MASRKTDAPRSANRLPYALTLPALIVIGVLFLFPGIYNVVLAFQKLTPTTCRAMPSGWASTTS